MFLAGSILTVPHSALAPEMTLDYDERTSLVSYRAVAGQVGSLIASAVPPLMVAGFVSAQKGWSLIGAVFGAFCLIPILVLWRFTRGWERYSEDTEALSVREMVQALYGNRSFRYVVGLYLFGVGFVYGFDASFMYFLQYHMGMSEEQISIFFLILFASPIPWIPVITLVSNRIGKRGTFMLFIAAGASISSVGFGLIQPRHVMVLYGLAIVQGAVFAATWQLIWAMIPDVVEVDEFKTGKRREGLYNGAATLILKLSMSLSIFLVSMYLSWIGYEPNIAQSPSVIFKIRIMQGPLWGTILVLSVVIAYFMPMTRERHKALLKAIEARKAGEPWDEESIRELL
jgi:GPH family glycoside/pentoside/hexuronide:cation symporter